MSKVRMWKMMINITYPLLITYKLTLNNLIIWTINHHLTHLLTTIIVYHTLMLFYETLFQRWCQIALCSIIYPPFNKDLMYIHLYYIIISLGIHRLPLAQRNKKITVSHSRYENIYAERRNNLRLYYYRYKNNLDRRYSIS